jgi:hypothetical protein
MVAMPSLTAQFCMGKTHVILHNLFSAHTTICTVAHSNIEDLRTIHGRVYATYQEAATALGLFEDESEAVRAMREAVAAYSRLGQLRFLFAYLLLDLRRLFKRSTKSSYYSAPRSSSRIASSYPGELLKSDDVELNCVTVDSPYRSVLASVVSSREGAKNSLIPAMRTFSPPMRRHVVLGSVTKLAWFALCLTKETECQDAADLYSQQT